MPGKYKRLIFGLLVFLGLMLMVGRIHLDTDKMSGPPTDAQLQEARQRAEAERMSRQLATAAKTNEKPLCSNPAQAAQDLPWLRQQRDSISHGAAFADAHDIYSLQPLHDVEDALRARQPADCLKVAASELQQAIYSAVGELVAARDTDTNAFDLRARIEDRMQHSLLSADLEFGKVDFFLRNATSNPPAPAGTPTP